MMHSHKTRLMLASVLTSVTALIAQPALGQSTDTNVRADDEIIVTARKKEENIQDVPISISAFSAEDIARKGITDLEAVADYTPGFIFEDFADNFNAAPNVRGLTQTDITQPTQNVAAFIDGIYLTRNFAFDVGSADLERLEVVKGPQSALYGRNAFGGAINYVFREPTEEFSADAEFTVGNHGRVGGKIGAGGYIVPDVLGVRLWGSKDKFGGSWKNGFPGATGRDSRAGGYDNSGFGGTVVFKPMDRLKIEGKYLKLDREAETSASYLLQGTRDQVELNCGPVLAPGAFRSPTPVGRNFICGDITPNPLDFASSLSTRPADPVILTPQQGTLGNTELISAKASFEIDDGLDVSYQFGRFEADANAQREVIFNPIDPSPLVPFGQIRPLSIQDGTTKADSHEIRLDYDKGGPLSASVGYYNSTVRDTRQFIVTVLTFPANIQLLSVTSVDTVFNDKIDAIFGTAEYEVSDQLTVRAEGRYTVEEKKRFDNRAPTLPELSRKFKYFTPRISVDYDLTPENLLYASASRGVKAGGFNRALFGGLGPNAGNELPIDEQVFDSETNWTYELGSKNEFLDGRLILNATLFYIDWSAAAISSLPGSLNPTVDGEVPSIFRTLGDVESYGIEVDGLFNLTDSLTFNYAASLNESQYRNGTISQRFVGICSTTPICADDGSVGGNDLPRFSPFQATAGFDYNTSISDKIDMFAGVDATHRSDQYVSELNLASIPARTVFNARIGVDVGNVSAFLWAKNLADEKYVSNSLFVPSSGEYTVQLGHRRTIGITTSLDF